LVVCNIFALDFLFLVKIFSKNIQIFILFFRILVGAPIGKNLQPKTNQSGALYKCPLTSYHDDCIQVVTDGKRSEYMSFFILKNIYIVIYIKIRNIKSKNKNPTKKCLIVQCQKWQNYGHNKSYSGICILKWLSKMWC